MADTIVQESLIELWRWEHERSKKNGFVKQWIKISNSIIYNLNYYTCNYNARPYNCLCSLSHYYQYVLFVVHHSVSSLLLLSCSKLYITSINSSAIIGNHVSCNYAVVFFLVTVRYLITSRLVVELSQWASLLLNQIIWSI